MYLADDDRLVFNWNEFLIPMILFDTFVMESVKLREVPFLIQKFGVDAV
jgi:hypothetical protein